MSDKYAVMGNPVSHSKSPFIHMQFAKQTHQDIDYSKIEVPLGEFASYVTKFIQIGGKGLNITLPFKGQAFDLTDNVSVRAKTTKSVNTLVFYPSGEIYADNTDGLGLIIDLTKRHAFDCANKDILIVGAGGAVRGILYTLLMQKPKQIIITNRTFEKAQRLAEEYDQFGNIVAIPIQELATKVDLIIQGTSASLSGGQELTLPSSILTRKTFCYDLMYSQKLTPFLAWAITQGCEHVANGIGMLVEQAAESFFLWRGIKPKTDEVIESLRSYCQSTMLI